MALAPSESIHPITPDHQITPSIAGQSKPLMMSEYPLVSVVIPVYNAADTLERAIRSIINQTYINWELFLVIDGSPDNSVDIARDLATKDSRIHVIIQDNQGAGASRNNGVEKSSGEYLAFLDSDDIWYPEKLERQLSVIRQSGNPVSFTYCWFYAFNEKNLLVNVPPAYTASGNIFDTVLKKEGVLIPSTTLLHRHIFESLNGYPVMSHHEDWHFSLRMTLDFEGYPTEEHLVLYSQTLSGKGRARKKYYDESVRIYVHEDPYLKSRISENTYQCFIERQKRSLFWSFLTYNYMDNARRYYPQVAEQDISSGLKGKLAWISMKSGINVLYGLRVLYQLYLQYAMLPWWRSKTAWAFK